MEQSGDHFDTGFVEEAEAEHSRRLSHELELKLIHVEDQERQKRFLELMESGAWSGIGSNSTDF